MSRDAGLNVLKYSFGDTISKHVTDLGTAYKLFKISYDDS